MLTTMTFPTNYYVNIRNHLSINIIFLVVIIMFFIFWLWIYVNVKKNHLYIMSYCYRRTRLLLLFIYIVSYNACLYVEYWMLISRCYCRCTMWLWMQSISFMLSSLLLDKLVINFIFNYWEFLPCYRCYLLLKGSCLCLMIQVFTVVMNIHRLVVSILLLYFPCFFSKRAATLTLVLWNLAE